MCFYKGIYINGILFKMFFDTLVAIFILILKNKNEDYVLVINAYFNRNN
jgi:hypothetical protein